MEPYFPERAGNRFCLLVDGPELFDAMLGSISRARHCVFIENYIVASGSVTDRFIRALIEARRRGVFVSLLLDAWGCQDLREADRAQLRDAGAEVQFYNPFRLLQFRRNLFRNHRRLVLVDGEVAYVGGFMLTDAYDPPGSDLPRWHDTGVRIEGPCVADWADLYLATRARVGRRSLLRGRGPGVAPAPASCETSPTSPGTTPGRVVISRPLHNEIKPSLVARIHAAQHRVWLTTPYFVPPAALRRALRRAADRGVDVRLLLTGPHTDLPLVRCLNRRFYPRLRRHGVRIFEYQTCRLHAKFAVCDDWVSIGSSNFDRWNFRWNLDGNQEIRGPAFATGIQDLFLRDVEVSEEYEASSAG